MYVRSGKFTAKAEANPSFLRRWGSREGRQGGESDRYAVRCYDSHRWKRIKVSVTGHVQSNIEDELRRRQCSRAFWASPRAQG
ncbi:hypothetical protein COMA2_180101 [Candidatus Nitrospira nitrificans]|uniref:Uncharacterized protein n=1 Tax=Candidatus Nitrospira nitrificans TaxID=1742973 RepID=A0A0S4LC46_9BACT|nr:hypothetical protein COMA2_180101 [Candidatus Nitrospira nitrificans]